MTAAASTGVESARASYEGGEGPWVVYDGQCPFCSSYVRLVRLKESVGELRLADARAGGAEVDECRALGFDLDKGMVFKYGGRHYFGADAIHAMSLLSGRSGAANRLLAALFRSPRRAVAWYPLLRLGRKAALRLRGRPDL